MLTYTSRLLFVILSSLMVSCSVFSPVKVQPQSSYVIDATPYAMRAKHYRNATLLVTDMDAASPYNTSKMAYSTRPFQIAYFLDNKWADTPASMLNPLIVETLQSSHYYRAVMATGLSSRYDYILHTQLIELLQDFTVNPAVVRLTVTAELSSVNSRRVIATKQFNIVESMQYKTPYSGVFATNRAVMRLLAQLRQFCLSVN